MRLLFSIIGCGLFFGIAVEVKGQSDPFMVTISQLKRSVAPVVCFQAQANKSWKLLSVEGTAFFISTEGRFLTAGHVIRGLTAPARKTACPIKAVYLPIEGWQPMSKLLELQAFQFTSCTVNDELDLALCHTLTNVTERRDQGVQIVPVIFETSLQQDGTAVAFTGFPLSLTQPITSRGAVGTYRIVKDDFGPRELIIDKNAWPGASGSPVYLENGRVIGLIVQRGIGDGSGIAIARTSGFVARFIASQQTKP